MKKVLLDKLAIGSLFKYGNTYAIKSEYKTLTGVWECIEVGSGEMFYGGVKNPNLLMVEPINLQYLLSVEQQYERMLPEYVKLDLFKDSITRQLAEF